MDEVAQAQSIYRILASKLPQEDRWYPDLKSDYLVVDLETTGFRPGTNKIVLLGVMPVRDGVPVEEETIDLYIKAPYDPITWQAAYTDNHPYGETVREMMLRHCDETGMDWEEARQYVDDNDGSIYGTQVPVVPEYFLREVDRAGRPKYRTAVDVTGITSEKLEEVGESRTDCMETLRDLLDLARRDNIPLVGHNSVKFDIPFIFHEIKDVIGYEFEWDENLVLDTGMVAKAAQLPYSLSAPKENETIYQWCSRIGNFRSRALWALDGHCVEAYGLTDKYGVDPSKQHQSAAYDCLVTNYLLREMASQQT